MDILMEALGKRTATQRDLDQYARDFEAERIPRAPDVTEDEIAEETRAVRAERRAREERKRA